jgi:hypothetical protein
METNKADTHKETKMHTYNEMNKKELRAACKAASLSNYSKMTVGGMRYALKMAEQLRAIDEKKEADLQDAMRLQAKVDAAPKATGVKIEKVREERNGVKRPSAGGKCRAVWDALDEYQAEEKEIPTASVVKLIAEDEGWNSNNAMIEFYQWRKFNGIGGRSK